MRIGTWNCRQGVNAKEAAVRSLADVLVVPECSAEPNWLAAKDSFAWKGDASTKGLGVFGMNGWTLEQHPARARTRPWELHASAYDPDDRFAFELLALWTVKRIGDGRRNYAGQVRETFESLSRRRRRNSLVVAGDFNASVQGPTVRRHRANVVGLEQLGLTSVYHHWNSLAHGQEKDMTLRWMGPGSVERRYHCDFILVSDDLVPHVRSVQIGTFPEWIGSGLSDHCPVVADLDVMLP